MVSPLSSLVYSSSKHDVTGKEKKRAGKSATQTQSGPDAALEISQADLRAAMVKLKDEPMPQSPEEKEHYFMSQVNLGEQLCAQGSYCHSSIWFVKLITRPVTGPAFHLAAALSFYRALRVYPSPVELIVIYQKTVPEPVFKVRSLSRSYDSAGSNGYSACYGIDKYGREFLSKFAPSYGTDIRRIFGAKCFV